MKDPVQYLLNRIKEIRALSNWSYTNAEIHRIAFMSIKKVEKYLEEREAK